MNLPDGAPAGAGDARGTVAAAWRAAWQSSGGAAGLVVASAPTVVFVAASALGGLGVAVVAAGVSAVATFAYRLARHEALGGALAGLAVAVACALVAARTGETRGFFLLPTALPAVILLVCLASLMARRPLTGLLLNRLAGGPTGWRRHRDLLRIYDVTTLIAVGVNVVNFCLQVLLYTEDQTIVLAVAHAATGPIFAALVAGTLVAVRRRLALERTA